MAAQQRGVVARWQLRQWGLSEPEARAALRGLPRVFRGICAVGELDDLGWLMAAALAGGPGAAISHLTALQLMGLRPWEPGPIHVSVPRGGGRCVRVGLVLHRRTRFERGAYDGIPATSPSQSLIDANILPHELYRAIEETEKRQIPLTLPAHAIFELRTRITGRTRSDAEARFIVLCHEHGLRLPRVNHRLNGFESDFHWRDERLVAEVDGWEFHHQRPQFETDRRRGVAHRIAGYEVIRFSALQVFDDPATVIAALLAAAPSVAMSRNRPRAA